MPDKNLRDEITELAEAVRELRDREVADTLRELRAEVEKLRAERNAHQCTCTHIHWQTYPAGPYTWMLPYTVTCGSGYVSSGDTYTVTTTNTTGGYNPAVTTLSLGN
jgi:ribosomal protein L29